MTLSEKIGKNLKAARNLKGYTQEYVGKQMGITQPAYARFEIGKFQLNYEQIDFLCELLDTTPDFLWGYVDEYGDKIKK